MTDVAVFHSVLGAVDGIHDAAERLHRHRHQVLIVDQYEGRTFEDYAEASAFAEQIGWPILMDRALAAVQALPDGFVCLGFSNGAGMAEDVATKRTVAGVVLCSGALPLEMIGVQAWPAGVAVQIHQTSGDPFRKEGWPESVVESVRAAGGSTELFEYPGSGHLFPDASRTEEYDPDSAEVFWQRVQAFCATRSPE